MSDFDVALGAALFLNCAEKIGEQLLDVLIVGSVKLRILMLHLLAVAGWIERPALLPGLMERAVSAVEVAADVFALLGVVAGVLAVFPDGGERLELELGHLCVGRIGRL